jgi:hypothetical protein
MLKEASIVRFPLSLFEPCTYEQVEFVLTQFPGVEMVPADKEHFEEGNYAVSGDTQTIAGLCGMFNLILKIRKHNGQSNNPK